MQTLKTAIVVLLMMTVLYGSYVSLTTSPEALPASVASLIEESGDFQLGIDDGLPESLASVSISSAPESDDADAALDFATATPVTAQFNRSPNGSLTAPAVSASMGTAARPASASMADLQFPKPSSAELPQADRGRDYPSTGMGQMALPDPSSLTAGSGASWNKDAKPVSFELPKSDGVSLTLSDEPPAVKPNNLGLANALRTADRQYAADQPMDALATLSLFYGAPDLTSPDREALMLRLDPLAATVIYSRRHLLEQPHRVGASETLIEIASRYDVPWQLLANINGIADPVSVLPGTELKVVRGPFRAEVDLARKELTIFLREMYAGRFNIDVGADPAPAAGTFTIQDKQNTQTFYDKNGSPVPPGDARNPYGTAWMDLGKSCCIHGSPDRTKPTDKGCISLAGADGDDLFGILSQGSTVTIR